MGRSNKKKKQTQESVAGHNNNDDDGGSADRSSGISLTIVIPGDNVTDKILSIEETCTTPKNKNKARKLGMGLRYDNNNSNNNEESKMEENNINIFATCAGRLEYNNRNHTFYIQQNNKRYHHGISMEDRVIGIVEDRMGMDGLGGEFYRINMGGPHTGIISNLSFEGATKRNKPNLFPGMILYCRISSLQQNNQNHNHNHDHRFYSTMDPILSCQLGPNDVGLSRKDWMTNEGTYGELKGGTLSKISIGLARELLHPNNIVLSELSKYASSTNHFEAIRGGFEVCIGVNGYLWIHSARPEYTILIQNAILNSQVLTEEQVKGMVKSLVYTVQKQIQNV